MAFDSPRWILALFATGLLAGLTGFASIAAAECGSDQVVKLLDRGFSHDEVMAICGIHGGSKGNAPTGVPSGGNAPTGVPPGGAASSSPRLLGIFQESFTNPPGGWVASIDGSAYVLTRKAEGYEYFGATAPAGTDVIGHRLISAEFKVNANDEPNSAIGAGLEFGRRDSSFYIFYLTAHNTAEICAYSKHDGFGCYADKNRKDEQNHVSKAKLVKLEVFDSAGAGGIVAVLNTGDWEERIVLREPEAAAGRMGLWIGGNKNDTFTIQNLQYTTNRDAIGK